MQDVWSTSPTDQGLQKGGLWPSRHIHRDCKKDPDMTGETMKVLMYLFGKLDFENFIQQTQIDVAEGLGMKTKMLTEQCKY